ncbi:helix-turn-helix domain-containing protein [Leptothrix discophora]|uniref:HTH crp-type domain-containing protein n=1 Tax=Leptothrix discophora TaxID=89 RepID=A0ABT9FZN2_LEPDI|nr:helix-turn-helix domain-containing protein [Leptothrix discophora]MDP4299686.1 hypothetical protein [Leptothrix discophora]
MQVLPNPSGALAPSLVHLGLARPSPLGTSSLHPPRLHDSHPAHGGLPAHRPSGAGAVQPRRVLQAGQEIDTFRTLVLPHVLVSGVAISRRPVDPHEDLQLLQPGDLIGLETFQVRPGERRVLALVDCELAPLRRMSDTEWRELLLHALLRRQSEPGLAGLRVGPVGERVRRLLLLLAQAGQPAPPTDGALATCELPPLTLMAAITGSTQETVCRVVSGLRKLGLLEEAGGRRLRLMPGLRLSAGELPGKASKRRAKAAA